MPLQALASASLLLHAKACPASPAVHSLLVTLRKRIALDVRASSDAHATWPAGVRGGRTSKRLHHMSRAREGACSVTPQWS